MIGELTAWIGGHTPAGALAGAVGEQLFDVGLADSDPAAGLWGTPGHSGAENAVRFLANPALRALSLLVAGPSGAGTAYELVVALVLAVLPFVLAAAVAGALVTHRAPLAGRTHPSATVAQLTVHPTAGVLVTMHTTTHVPNPVSRDGELEGGEQMTGQALESVRAEALFVSDVQRSDHLTADQVRVAVLNTVRRHGSRNLAALVAAEYGEHPEIAVGRMSWAIGTIRAAYPTAA